MVVQADYINGNMHYLPLFATLNKFQKYLRNMSPIDYAGFFIIWKPSDRQNTDVMSLSVILSPERDEVS